MLHDVIGVGVGQSGAHMKKTKQNKTKQLSRFSYSFKLKCSKRNSVCNSLIAYYE